MTDTRTYNPFRDKALRARQIADRLAGKHSARDDAFAAAFPLGAGFGHGSQLRREKRIDASVNHAVKVVEAEKRAKWLEASAAAYDAGQINAQGRAINAESEARSAKRRAQAATRETRQNIAKALVEAAGRANVTPETWADAAGYFAGSGRSLVLQDQRDYLERVSNPYNLEPDHA